MTKTGTLSAGGNTGLLELVRYGLMPPLFTPMKLLLFILALSLCTIETRAAIITNSHCRLVAIALAEKESKVIQRGRQIESRIRPAKPGALIDLHEANQYDVSRLAQQGIPIDKITLSLLGIPAEMQPFYTSAGDFSYQPPRTYDLALENGDEPFHSFRINVNPTDAEAKEMSLLDDYVRIIKENPDESFFLKVMVGGKQRDGRTLPDLRERVEQKLSVLDDFEKMRVKVYFHEDYLGSFSFDEGKQVGQNDVLVPRFYDGAIPEIGTAHLRAHQFLLDNKIADLQSSPFAGDPGDIVVGARHIFIGQNTVILNRRKFFVGSHHVTQSLSRLWKKPTVLIDALSLGVPFYELMAHLDFLVAVVRDRNTKEEVVLLTSPKALIKALQDFKGPLPEKPHAHWSDWGGRELLRSLQNELAGVVQAWEQWNDKTKTQLKGLGYTRFIDMPGVSYGLIDPNTHAKSTVNINYTNSHFGGEYAVAPRLAIHPANVAANKIFQSLGYRILPIYSAPFYLSKRGGARCTSFPMRRMGPR